MMFNCLISSIFYLILHKKLFSAVMQAYRHCMESTKLIFLSSVILRHFPLIILNRSPPINGFIPLSCLIVHLHEVSIEIGLIIAMVSLKMWILGGQMYFLSAYSVRLGSVWCWWVQKKKFFCSGMIEHNATDHFHVQFTVKNNFAWRYRIIFCKGTKLCFSWISQFRSKVLWSDEKIHLLLAIDNLKSFRLNYDENFISRY